MTIKIPFLFSICLGISSCIGYPSCPVAYFQPFEMTVKVIDRDGKPVGNRKVEAIDDYQNFQYFSENSGNNRILASAITDNTGKAILTYKLSHNCSQTHYGIIAVKGDSLFQPVNAITHRNNEEDKVKDVLKLSGTIRMDSLVAFKMRIKSNKNNVDTLNLRVESFSNNDTTVYRLFTNSWHFRAASFLDTIVSVNVYSKAPFLIRNSIRCSDGSRLNGKTKVIDNTVNRNLMFLDEIN